MDYIDVIVSEALVKCLNSQSVTTYREKTKKKKTIFSEIGSECGCFNSTQITNNLYA